MAKLSLSKGVVHNVTPDMREALTSDKNAYTAWESLTPLARNEWICWVTYVKMADTRREHIVRMIEELKDGVRRPCCWYGCIHRTDKKISPSIQSLVVNKLRKK